MNKSITLFFAMILTVHLGFAQSTDPVLMTVGGQPVTRDEFVAIFKKNNKDSVITKEDLDEYLELFINFKLKVREAEELGMDTSEAFHKELAGYRMQLARPYLTDSEVTDSLVQEAYKRLNTEVHAAHILITVAPDAAPADTLKAYNKALTVLKTLEGGADFKATAKKYSEDPSASENGGDLGYFTALQMVYPFEKAAFNTEVGEITGPIRTRFGYHILKVLDKRNSRGMVRVQHIMVMSEKQDPEELQDKAKERIDEVYKQLQDGRSFEELARKFSDDRSSASRGGELAPFGPGKMVSEFEEASYNLTEPGAYSKPFRTPYGWHIVKLVEKIPLAPLSQLRKELEGRIARDSRSELSHDTFVAKLKKQYNYQADVKQLKPFYKEIDSTYFSGNWQPSEKLAKRNKTLFTLDGKQFTQQDFYTYLLHNQGATGKAMNPEFYVNHSFEKFVDKTIMEYENSQLSKKYPEFRSLMNEYHDGILLFDLTDKRVYSKAIEDTAGLRDYYKNHLQDFMWGPRVKADIYTTHDEKIAEKVRTMLKNGKEMETILNSINKETALNLKVESGLYEKEDEAILKEMEWKTGISEVISNDNQYHVVAVHEIMKPNPKDFEEARGLITAAYQNYLEQEWVNSLRDRYKVEVNRTVLYSIK